MGVYSRLLIVSMGVMCLGLTGCKSEVEFSEAPFPTEDKSEVRPVRTTIFASLPVDLTEFQVEIDRVIPDQLLRINSWLSKAACYERRGRKRCDAARVRGVIVRDGAMKLKPYAGGISAIIPVKADFSAKGQGYSKDVGDSISEHFALYISYKVELNEKWQAKVSLGKISLGKNAVAIKLLGRDVKYKSALERKVSRVIRNVARKLATVLNEQPFRDVAAKSWRRLFNPIQISSTPEIWLRGRPMSVGFGGFGVDGDRLTSRIAIGSLLSTHQHERPVPLMPMPLPPLTGAQAGDGNSHINISLPVKYDEFADGIMEALMRDAVDIGSDENQISVRALGGEIYASKRFLALQLDVESDVAEEWFARSGKLYLTALPWFNAEKGLLTLKHVNMTEPKTNPKFFLDGRFLMRKVPFTKWFKEALSLDLNDRFETVLADTNSMMSLKIDKALWLHGLFKEIGVSSISPRQDHLQLNLKLRGILTLSQSAPAGKDPLGTKLSAALIPTEN